MKVLVTGGVGYIGSHTSVELSKKYSVVIADNLINSKIEVLERLNEKQKHILGFSSFGTLGGHDGSSVSPAEFDPNRESIGILKP